MHERLEGAPSDVCAMAMGSSCLFCATDRFTCLSMGYAPPKRPMKELNPMSHSRAELVRFLRTNSAVRHPCCSGTDAHTWGSDCVCACRGRLLAVDPTDGHIVRETLHRDARALSNLSPSPQGSR